MVGAAAALTAARLGDRVVLIQDRPHLGGNASIEVGLSPRGVKGPFIEELSERLPNGDLVALDLLMAETNATVYIEHTVYSVVLEHGVIRSVDARDARSGRESRFSAPQFIDCSGRAILGLLSGAETLSGRESRAEYGENLAPARRDGIHHGNTIFFRTRMTEKPTTFPYVPWATEVAKDFSNLGGQLRKPGIENGPGPLVPLELSIADSSSRRRMQGPLTHFWEYGQYLDPYTQGEAIRDHLLRAIYGTISNVKTREPSKFANLELDWMAHVPATGGYLRYKGDHVLTENDVRHQNSGAFCLHYPGHQKYDFRLKFWEWDERDGEPYEIPFRCLYSANISNLMFAGKSMSATHVAASNTKFMGNGGQHAIATAAAAHLCKKYGTTPKGRYKKHVSELQDLVALTSGVNCRTLSSRL